MNPCTPRKTEAKQHKKRPTKWTQSAAAAAVRRQPAFGLDGGGAGARAGPGRVGGGGEGSAPAIEDSLISLDVQGMSESAMRAALGQLQQQAKRRREEGGGGGDAAAGAVAGGAAAARDEGTPHRLIDTGEAQREAARADAGHDARRAACRGTTRCDLHGGKAGACAKAGCVCKTKTTQKICTGCMRYFHLPCFNETHAGCVLLPASKRPKLKPRKGPAPKVPGQAAAGAGDE